MEDRWSVSYTTVSREIEGKGFEKVKFDKKGYGFNSSYGIYFLYLWLLVTSFLIFLGTRGRGKNKET